MTSLSAAWMSVLLAALVLAGGCRRAPALRPLARDATILAFGDSLTAGDGAAEGASYPAVLAHLMGRRVINAGRSGELSAEGLARLPAVLEEYRPALVILCHGGNDILQKRDPGEIARHLSRMAAAVRGSGADVLMIGVPAPGLRLRIHPLYRRVAREARLALEAESLPDILSTPKWKSDYVHPNATGYRRLAEAVARRIAAASR